MSARVSSCLLLVTLFMFLSALTPVADLEGIVTQSTTVVSEPVQRGMSLAGTPHGPIAIDGDANFSDTALLEGWPGDGTSENPYIIEGLDIDLGGAHGQCISIINTRASFTIRNCNLTGATSIPEPGSPEPGPIGSGIYLVNVSNGGIVNNICNYNRYGICLMDSEFNTVANNTCTSNELSGIHLLESHFNIVVNNICNYNRYGINLQWSGFNTITNNTLNGCGFFFIGTLADCRQLEVTGNSVNALPLVFLQNQVGNIVSSPAGQVILVGCSQVIVKDQTLMDCSVGILLCHTNLTTLINNICNSNRVGINLYLSRNNTVTDDTCTSNDIGIYLYLSGYNIVVNNICTSNGVGINLYLSDNNTVTDDTCTNNTVTGISLIDSDSNIVTDNTCSSNGDFGIYLQSSYFNTVENNICNNNRIGIYLYLSNNNTVIYNICNYNMIGISLYRSDNNTVTHNTCLSNTEHDIYLVDSDSSTVENNITTLSKEFVYLVLLLIGFGGITLLGTGWRKVSARGVKDSIIAPTSYMIASWFSKRRVGHDEIIVPIRHRLASRFRNTRPLKHMVVDEILEPDSTD